MFVNGREIPVKDGVGIYNFTPKRSGRFTYQVEISYKNQLTGRSDNYSRTFFATVP